MSGTSGDGVDASIISTNGVDHFESIKDKYFEYDNDIYKNIHLLKDKINTKEDLKKHSDELKDLERKITIFHAKIIKDLDVNNKDFIVGFHGQPIYHNSMEKITKQLGDGNLLNQLSKKNIIYNFRENDIKNNGEGAPLTPIFHQLLVSKNSIKIPICILNLGGISNVTVVKDKNDYSKIYSKDLGPGNCLIDSWVRKNSNFKFDFNGNLAKSGEVNQIILEQAQELYANRINKEKLSFDVNDFDISFARGLNLNDGSATLTDFTSKIIAETLSEYLLNLNCNVKNILICGGGRKNKLLIEKIKKLFSKSFIIQLIDEYGFDGDYIESQAFAFIAVRSFKKLPITFPNTTGCEKPCIGGDLVTN